MVELAWRPDFRGRGIKKSDTRDNSFWGNGTRRQYLDMLEAAMVDDSVGSVILRGNFADDRISLVTNALKRVDDRAEPIHAIGTVYSQKLVFGALAFLLTDIDENEEIGPTGVMRAITKSIHHRKSRPVVVVQYPHLLDPQTSALLAQMAYGRSILLVILAVNSETLPTEFGPVAAGDGCCEINVEPLSLSEVHQTLVGEFSAVPTPVVTAALRQRSQGILGLMLALAHDALASQKLTNHGGYLVMNEGPWPHGARVESVAMAQTAMLGATERKLLQHIAVAGAVSLASLNRAELVDVDHLLVAGLVTRTGKNRGHISHSSSILAEVFRNESHTGGVLNREHSPCATRGFYGFISGNSASQALLLDEKSGPATILFSLLDNLRNYLLDGELDEVESTIKLIARDYLDELSPELFETLVISQSILQITADCGHLAVPALTALAMQFGARVGSYEHWLIHAMRNFTDEFQETAQGLPLPFDEQWESGRWWFTELIMPLETVRLVPLSGRSTRSLEHSRSETLMKIVRLRNGSEQSMPYAAQCESELSASAVDEAWKLISPRGSKHPEERTLAGLETLIEAGFVVFALPRGNCLLEALSMNGKLTVAGWLKRMRKGNAPRSPITSEDLLGRDYPFLEVLTNREKMVATAAALGMNNQQIASDAGVSIRTVEGHLYQIYSKLALAGRRELSSLVEASRIDTGVKA